MKQPESLQLSSDLLALGYGGTCSLAAAELRRLHEENIALRKCAIKYLDYLRIPDQEKALESDMKNKEMLK